MPSSSRAPLSPSEREILIELLERASRTKPVFADPAFPAQAAFLRDPSRFRVMLGTRRAAKSYGVALDFLLDAQEHPKSNYLVVGLTRESVKKALWKEGFKLIDERLSLGLRFNESDLTVTTKSGAVVYLLGMDSDDRMRERARGGKYRKIAIDEAQSFAGDLGELVKVLRPALADERGALTLAGTPGIVRTGLFFDLTHDQDPQQPGQWTRAHLDTAAEWSGHRWNAGANPYMREQWAEEIAGMLAVNPRITETPGFIREYLGRWVLDDSKLVYRYLAGRNDFATLPNIEGGGRWHRVLGIDLGYHPDPSAFTLVAYHDNDRALYLLESEKHLKMDITDVADRIRRFQADAEPHGGIDALVIDGSALQAVEEMRRRHGLPLQAADKRGKSDFIELMNAEMIQGRVLLAEKCAPLKAEYGGLVWDDRVTTRREEHPACANHATDSALYAWRHCYAYLSTVLPVAPKRGTPEWFAAEESAMLAQARERVRRKDDEWGNAW